jgi:hypothetical protein
MLRSQCRVWKKEINAVLYVPHMKDFGVISDEVTALNGTSLEEVGHLVDHFFRDVTKEKRHCNLNLQVVVEEFDDWLDPTWSYYPTNALRNRALMMARTKAVLLLDVDFLVSKELSDLYDSKKRFANLMDTLDQKVGVVLPAFETANMGSEGVLLAQRIAFEGKDAMVAAYQRGDALAFQVAQYSPGHGPDDADRWVSTSTTYPIQYQKGYEPYLLMRRDMVPWFDERMRGYSRNKIVHINHLAEQLGVELRVHERGFVVHVPHPKASTFRKTKENGQWEVLLDLYIKIRRDISLGEFVPVTSFAKRKRLCSKTVNAESLSRLIRKKLKIKRQKRLERQNAQKSRKDAKHF